MLTKDLEQVRRKAGDYEGDKARLQSLRERVALSRMKENDAVARARFEASEARKKRQEALRARWKAMTSAGIVAHGGTYGIVADGDIDWDDDLPERRRADADGDHPGR